MKVGYKNKRVKQLCEDSTKARKQYGDKTSRKLFMRLSWLRVSTNLDTFNSQYKTLRLHKLNGDYKDCYALDINDGYRLIFYPCDENGDLCLKDFKDINVVTIQEVSNHYAK